MHADMIIRQEKLNAIGFPRNLIFSKCDVYANVQCEHGDIKKYDEIFKVLQLKRKVTAFHA